MAESQLETEVESCFREEERRAMDPVRAAETVSVLFPGLNEEATEAMSGVITDADADAHASQVAKYRRERSVTELREWVGNHRKAAVAEQEAFRPDDIRSRYTTLQRVSLSVLQTISSTAAAGYEARVDARIMHGYEADQRKRLEARAVVYRKARQEASADFRSAREHVTKQRVELIQKGKQLKSYNLGLDNAFTMLTQLQGELSDAYLKGDGDAIQRLEKRQTGCVEAIDTFEQRIDGLIDDIYLLNADISAMEDTIDRSHDMKSVYAHYERDFTRKGKRLAQRQQARDRGVSPKQMESDLDLMEETDRIVARLDAVDGTYRSVAAQVPRLHAVMPDGKDALETMQERQERWKQRRNVDYNAALDIVRAHQQIYVPTGPAPGA